MLHCCSCCRNIGNPLGCPCGVELDAKERDVRPLWATRGPDYEQGKRTMRLRVVRLSELREGWTVCWIALELARMVTSGANGHD